ncbi:MAG: hypothetical protein PVJ02_17885 [Gemmatimonadota bacterium]|jgi:hypothetical protein
MTEKRYNDEEVSLILRRALEGDGGGSGEAGGLTLRQLKEIAAEVGIDPARVESAALAVQAEGAAGESRRLRVSTRYDVVVEGHVSPERRGEILRRIRAAMGRHGVVREDADGLEWKARDYFGGRYLTIRAEEEGTRIEALGNFRDGAFTSGALGGTLGLMVTATAFKVVGGIGAVGFAGPLALLAGAALPGWALYRRWFRKEDAALRQAVADIAACAATGPDAEAADPTLDAPDPAPGLPRGGSSPGGAEPPRR